MELQKHIKEYAQPVGRIDWRQGSAINRKILGLEDELKMAILHRFYRTIDMSTYKLWFKIYFYGSNVF